MNITTLTFAEPFFSVKHILYEKDYPVGKKSIVLNLSQMPLLIKRPPTQFFSIHNADKHIYRLCGALHSN